MPFSSVCTFQLILTWLLEFRSPTPLFDLWGSRSRDTYIVSHYSRDSNSALFTQHMDPSSLHWISAPLWPCWLSFGETTSESWTSGLWDYLFPFRIAKKNERQVTQEAHLSYSELHDLIGLFPLVVLFTKRWLDIIYLWSIFCFSP